jgi:hypothetical protein
LKSRGTDEAESQKLMTPRTLIRRSPHARWSDQQSTALEAVRKAGFAPVEDGLFHLHESLWQNVPVARERRREVRKFFAGIEISATVHWGPRLEQAGAILCDAVIREQLKLSVWPAALDDEGNLQIDASAEGPVIVPTWLVKRLRGFHGGLPMGCLLVPDSIVLDRSASLPVAFPPDGLPVIEMRQFSVWLEAERGKGNWASQIDRHKKAGRGRPSKVAAVDPIIRALVETGDWSPAEPVSKLAELVRQRLQDDVGGVNDDTVRKALDRIFTRTGDRRFCGRSFLRRNRNWVKQP